MDYFILLNIARILDNRGKNIYLCRYDIDEPYFLTPWDLDGSWGLLWNGTNDSKTEGVLSNNLFDRIIENDVEGFRKKISDRWNNLRMSLLSNDALTSRINNTNQFLITNQVYEKEESIWNYDYSGSDLTYMFEWINDRLEFLDQYFNELTSVVHPSAENFKVYPNPAYDYIHVVGSFRPSISAKVYNMYGVLLIENDGFSEDKKISIQDLSPGMYIIEIGGDRNIFYKG
jgi:hypothetical protein